MKRFSGARGPIGESQKRAAFTLIELLVVLAILGLIGGLASIRLSGVLNKARVQSATDRLMAADHFLRNEATRDAKLHKLAICLNESRVLREIGDREEEIIFSSGVFIDGCRISGRTRLGNREEIAFSHYGETPTYALCVKATGVPPRWLVFAGGSGQAWQTEDETDVTKLFAVLQPSRPHAD